MSRPKMSTEIRVHLSTTVDKKTMDDAEALRRDRESLGQVVDRAIEALKKEEKKS